jgi:(2Fe-2S) ferredoxin
MSRYRRHVFVCINQRPAGHPKGCCHDKGSEEIRDTLKVELAKRGLAAIVRANASGCLDACEHGITVVIYPDAIWYGRVTVDDIPEIVDRTIIRGEVIQRLLIPDSRYKPEMLQVPPLDLPSIPGPE